MKKGFSGHNHAVSKSDEWLTPPEIIHLLGPFDLDPCSPVFRPWPTASRHYTIIDNGLIQPWQGRVWLNPPYGDAMAPWLIKMGQHGNGIALTFARTDTHLFHDHVFPKADSMFFIKQRLNFYTVAGTRARAAAGAPSVLLAYGEMNSDAIAGSGMEGKHVPLNSVPVIVVGISHTWKVIVTQAMIRLKGESDLSKIYDLVERISRDRLKDNRHYKAKVRQVLQYHFSRVKRGYYSMKQETEAA